MTENIKIKTLENSNTNIEHTSVRRDLYKLSHEVIDEVKYSNSNNIEVSKKKLKKELDSIGSDFGIDLITWNNCKYDYLDILEYIRNLRNAFQLLDKEVDGIRLVISGNGKTGIVKSEKGEKLISIDYKRNPSEISHDILEALTELKSEEEVTAKLSEIAKDFGLKSLSLWNNEDYNCENILSKIPNLRLAFGLLGSQTKDNIGGIRFVIEESDRLGMRLTSENDKVIAVNPDQSSQDIVKVISESVREYKIYEKLSNELLKLAADFGISSVFLWSNKIYKYQDISDNLPTLRSALEKMNLETLNTLKKVRIALDDETELAKTSEHEKVICLDLVGNNSTSDIIQIVSRLTQEWEDYHAHDVIARQMISKNISTGQISNIDEFYPDEQVQKWLEDPTVKHVLKVSPDWLIDPKPPEYKITEFRVMIARNLYIQDEEVNQDTVLAEYHTILASRERYREIPLFKGRNVLLVAHNEINENGRIGEHVFGTDATKKAIEDQGTLNVDRVRADQSLESLKSKKKQILDRIETSQPPFTFVFNGHGSSDRLFLSKGQIENGEILAKDSISISYGELAFAFAKRYKKYPKLLNTEPENQDILVFSSCYNHTFVRNFYVKLKLKLKSGWKKYLPERIAKWNIVKWNFSLPIALGASEYNQYGYHNSFNKYGGDFWKNILNLKEKGHITTFGTMMNKEDNGDTNPYLYIPAANGQFRQIAKNEIDNRETRFSV